jgi:hypothetical protein
MIRGGGREESGPENMCVNSTGSLNGSCVGCSRYPLGKILTVGYFGGVEQSAILLPNLLTSLLPKFTT